jgi:anti-anti-sigma factor
MNHIDATRQGNCLFVRLVGEFATDAAADMDAVLAAAPAASSLVLDLSEATRLGGLGISYLIRLQTRLSTQGGSLFLRNVAANVARELVMRDLAGFFRVVEEWDDDMGDDMLSLLAVR